MTGNFTRNKQNGKILERTNAMTLEQLVALQNALFANAPFSPEDFLGKGWKLLIEEQDKTSTDLTEIDLAKCDFVNCFVENETRITGEVKLSRLKESKVRHGASVFMGLWMDYQTRKKESVLEKLYKSKGITCLDFFGDVLLDPGGGRCVLYLYRSGDGVWNWGYRWLVSGWHVNDLSLVSGQVS